MGIENEVKFEVSPGDLEKLTAARSLRPANGQLAKHKYFVSTYFDTPKHALRRNGVSLRVRQAGKKHVQTIKTARDGIALKNPFVAGPLKRSDCSLVSDGAAAPRSGLRALGLAGRAGQPVNDIGALRLRQGAVAPEIAPQQIAILHGNGGQLASIFHGWKADLAVAPSSSGKGP